MRWPSRLGDVEKVRSDGVARPGDDFSPAAPARRRLDPIFSGWCESKNEGARTFSEGGPRTLSMCSAQHFQAEENLAPRLGGAK